jgi:Tfp pilus assembly protein PilV
MSLASQGHRQKKGLRSRSFQAAFTLVEVAIAAGVMALAITTSITTLQHGLTAVDTARNMTLASQIMQSQVEVLRLQNWSQICALQTGANPFTVQGGTTITDGVSTSPTALDNRLSAIANRFSSTRQISDVVVDGATRPNIKLIMLTVTWTGVDRRVHSLNYQTRYAKNGLSDYLYIAH